MEKDALKYRKILLSNDPRCIPGFAGHCPQFKYQMGKSFGKLCRELLPSPGERYSAPPAALKGHLPAMMSDDGVTREVIPGYSGFIPNRHNYVGCSFSETCRKALAEFHQQRSAEIQRRSLDLPAIANYPNQQLTRPTLPFTPICSKVFIYKPLKPFTPLKSPYLMDDDDPNKYFMSGFAGHVPKSRFLVGKGFPAITNQALIEFGQQNQGGPKYHRQDSPKADKPSNSRSSKGMLPSYSGHVPGYRFMCGQTYGQLTQKALEKFGSKRFSQ